MTSARTGGRGMGLAAGAAWLAWIAAAYLRLDPWALRARSRLPLHYHQWAYAHLAYSDLIALYGARHLAWHLLPYLQAAIEYPVLMGWLFWVTAWAPGFQGYFLAAAGIVAAAGIGILVLLRRLVPGKFVWFALTPLALLYGLLNWDVVGIFLLVAAVDAYDRRRWAAAGLWLAAGTWFKLFPVIVLPFWLLDRAREGDRAGLLRLLAAFAALSVLLNLPPALLNFGNWSWFFRFNAGRGYGGSLWGLPWVPVLPLRAVDGLSLLLVSSVALAAGRRVLRGMAPMTAAAWVFLTFFLVNKVFSPQYMLWMFAAALLADWPGPALAALTLGGVIDYVNSFTALYLMQEGARSAAWYAAEVYPLGLAARYLALAGAGLLTALGRGRGQAVSAAVPARAAPFLAPPLP